MVWWHGAFVNALSKHFLSLSMKVSKILISIFFISFSKSAKCNLWANYWQFFYLLHILKLKMKTMVDTLRWCWATYFNCHEIIEGTRGRKYGVWFFGIFFLLLTTKFQIEGRFRCHPFIGMKSVVTL